MKRSYIYYNIINIGMKCMANTTILLVDDDRLVLVTLAKGLEKAGYTVLQASSAKESIELCKHSQPDIAIFDVRMPEMSGIDAANTIFQECKIPFIMLSAYNEADMVHKAIKHGALCYLVKPIDVAQLIPAIESSLQRARDIRALMSSEENLNIALNSRRETSTAIGILMERYHLTNEQAFEMLRSQARSRRQKVADLAEQVVSATENLNGFFDIKVDTP